MILLVLQNAVKMLYVKCEMVILFSSAKMLRLLRFRPGTVTGLSYKVP